MTDARIRAYASTWRFQNETADKNRPSRAFDVRRRDNGRYLGNFTAYQRDDGKWWAEGRPASHAGHQSRVLVVGTRAEAVAAAKAAARALAQSAV